LFAAPHGLSQRTTSFIACACQGIHRTPLLYLITLILNARLDRRAHVRPAPERAGTGLERPVSRELPVAPDPCGPALRTTLLFTMSHQQAAGRSTAAANQLLPTSMHGSHTTNGGARRDRTDDLLLAKQALSQLSYGPLKPCPGTASRTTGRRKADMVGLGRFELPTSPLSGVRSNQLSYRPSPRTNVRKAGAPGVIRTRYRSRPAGHRPPGRACRRKRNEDGEVSPFVKAVRPDWGQTLFQAIRKTKTFRGRRGLRDRP
jgi:hypothetical protein